MLKALDSAYPPNATQAAQAKAAGYSAWLGYFAGPNILNGWSKASFDTVKAAGLMTAAYCSGWADPAAMKAQSISWGVPIILDDESGIRSFNLEPSDNRKAAHLMYPQGSARPVVEKVNSLFVLSSWVNPWLAASGAGLYGNLPVFAGAVASCYVFAAYPGADPGTTWPSYYTRPPKPCGWQWQGTHSLFGVGVDTTNFDDNFFPLAGGGGGVITGDDQVLYIGPNHTFPATTFKAYVAGNWYSQPFASLPPAGTVTVGATYEVDAYIFSSSSVNATIPPEADFLWWHAKTGGWVPDALLDTSALATSPPAAWPAAEPVAQLFDAATNKYIPLLAGTPPAPDDDSAFALKTDLASYALKTDLNSLSPNTHVHVSPSTTTGPAK